MSVKNLTLFSLSFLLLAGCGRGPKVRHYVEITQAPPSAPAPEAAGLPPDHPLRQSLPEDHPLRGGMAQTELPPDHPLRETLPEEHPLLGGMRAAPLTVEPIPENLPPNHPTLSMGAAPETAAPAQANRMVGRESEVPPPPSARDLAWEVPEGWRQRPGGGMRLATFVVDGDDTGAITTLVVLQAAAGGVDANIARWRGELELPPDPPAPAPTIGGQIPFVLVNLVPEAAEAGRDSATLGAIYDLGDRTAFLKFMGHPDVLRQEGPNFLRLAASLRRLETAE